MYNDTLAAVGAAFLALTAQDNEVRGLRDALASALNKRQHLREALQTAQRAHARAQREAPVNVN